jgi:hypothetical protein
MSPAWSRVLRVLAVVYVTAAVVHVGWVMAHEPFAFDAWNVAMDTKAQPFSIGRFFDYWSYEYTHSNPRIGQAFTYLSYKLEYFAVVATPLAYLAIAVGTFVLGTGRRPRRGRDFALVCIALGFIWFAFPQIGKTLFNRAYGANYVYGAAIQLWFLVALRIGRLRPIPFFFAGLVAGLCNEHTGPTLCAFMLAYAWFRHRGDRAVWAGAVGCIIGFAALFFAPGQGERYDGLVQKVGLVGRLLSRGITGNLDIVRSGLLGAAPLLAVVVIVILVGKRDENDRPARNLITLGLIATLTIAISLFVSPKLGPRFFIMPLAVVLAGVVALIDARFTDRQLIPAVVLAVVATGYAMLHTIQLYKHLDEGSRERLAALRAAPAGSVFTADSFEQVDDSWWSLGDDFRDIRKRQMIASYFGLYDVVYRAFDPEAPLGVTDVRLLPHSEGKCIEGELELGWYKGNDVASIYSAFKRAVDRSHLVNVELLVKFIGARPRLPREKLVVDSYVAQIQRKPRHRERRIVLPASIARADIEVFIYQVGGEARRLGTGTENLVYVPWKTGAYWVLACDIQQCFVVAALRQAR